MVTILAPAYNEELVIEQFVNQIELSLDTFVKQWELLIINDGSSDKTKIIVESLTNKYKNLRLINHEYNKGIGKALETGFKDAKGDIIITMDADCSHSPNIIKELVENINNGYDVVIASRYVKGGGMHEVPLWRQYISKCGNICFRAITHIHIKDTTTGYRAYSKKVIGNLDDLPNGFEVQLEILNRLKNYNIKEIPLVLTNRAAGQSKMNYIHLLIGYIAVFKKILF